ncbi:MAG: hypothetical protein WKH64_14750 [Chloroflexia bacterium]
MNNEPETDRLESRERIRGWYTEAKRMGVSDEDFYREMTPICGVEELDAALAYQDE